MTEILMQFSQSIQQILGNALNHTMTSSYDLVSIIHLPPYYSMLYNLSYWQHCATISYSEKSLFRTHQTIIRNKI